MRVNCLDCRHLILPRGQWCSAPQLRDAVDGPSTSDTLLTEASAAREFKAVCGYDAKWFAPRKESNNG